MKIILVTDAWVPQVNGVMRTLQALIKNLVPLGYEVEVVDPSRFPGFPLPWYREIKMVYQVGDSNIRQILKPPCIVHIATEFAVGLAFRRYCGRRNIPFTTAYHTDFPAYVKKYVHVPQNLTYKYFHWFHRRAEAVLVSTQTMKDTLIRQRFANIRLWSKGVDTTHFRPRPSILGAGKPVCLYVGRVAHEKNIEAFLECRNNVRKYVVGDGPILEALKEKYKDVTFFGKLEGEKLAEVYASANCFVFPSKTDTLGLVLLEALASAVPVAAYPVQGPIDVVGGNTEIGCLNSNLEIAIDEALKNGKPQVCRQFAQEHSWEKSTEEFLRYQVVYGS